MAGTIPSLSLSMQFDKDTGKQLKGGKLYFFAANTQTPQNAFQDTALTILHPNPITLDGAGRIPEFYVADGSIHFRLTNSMGTTQLEALNALVVGPSSGGGGGGPSVDPTTIFQTGDVIWLDFDGTRAGWVRDNGKTISPASGGGTERANADCHALFVYLWNNFSNTLCPVIGGRGASAEADWAAPPFGKQITLPDKRGYSPCGLDTMGNTNIGHLALVPFLAGSTNTLAGGLGGEAQHQLVTSEIPSHTHTATVTEPNSGQGHKHTVPVSGFGGPATGGGQVATGGSTDTSLAPTGITVTNSSTGGDGTHNNTQLIVLGSFFRKL